MTASFHFSSAFLPGPEVLHYPGWLALSLTPAPAPQPASPSVPRRDCDPQSTPSLLSPYLACAVPSIWGTFPSPT